MENPAPVSAVLRQAVSVADMNGPHRPADRRGCARGQPRSRTQATSTVAVGEEDPATSNASTSARGERK